MAYIFQLRRGWKTTDESGNIIRDDWATYEAKADHMKPLEGELVLEYDNGIPRLKIGNGVDEFSVLPYMSVDSFILPKPISVTLYADKWEQMLDTNGNAVADTYYQVVTVDNATITENSRVDLQPSPEQLAQFYDLGIVLTTENNVSIITTYVVGELPTEDYIIPATVTEVVVEEGVVENG